jgi:tetratricopeptide (TPR) repeat protein
MKHGLAIIFTALRLLALACTCLLLPAHADDYAHVNQLLRSGKLTEAMVQADAYLAGKPRDPQMRLLKGLIQRSAGKQADAVNTFSKLIEDYPELPEPYNNLAVIYAAQGQFDKARSSLEMAVRIDHSYATAYENLGDVYARLASQAYSKSLQLDSTNVTVQPKLTLIRELLGNADKARVASAPVPAPVASKAGGVSR